MGIKDMKRLFIFSIAVTFLILSVGDDWVSAQVKSGGDESFGAFVKEVVFIRKYRRPEVEKFDEEINALKGRRSQIVEMINMEKDRLTKAPKWTVENIRTRIHIAYLENCLEQVDMGLSKIFEATMVVDEFTLQKLAEDFTNRELTLEDMKDLADLVTMAYQEKGYVLARAFLPEQEVKDGVLKISIMEGNIGKVKVSGNKYYKDRVVKRYFQPQVEHGVIREQMLERALLLTNDVPLLETKVVLKKGEQPGSADLILDTEDRFAFKFGLDYNNFGHKLVGENRYGTHMQLTDPWWGSTLALRGVTGSDPKDSTLFSTGLNIPVYIDGTNFSFNYLKGNYLVGQDLQDLGLEGDSQLFGMRITRPFIRTANKNLSVGLGYERKYSTNYLDDEVSSKDKLNVISATLDFDLLDRFLGKTLVSVGYYRGALYQASEEIPVSRENADVSYNRVSIDAARVQKIYGYTNIMLRGSGQYTSNRLVPLEEVVLGGYGTVRGHEPAKFLGDSGYTLSAELMCAPPFIGDKNIPFLDQRLAQMVQFAAFFDHGGVYRNDPVADESDNEYMSGYGGGIRLFYKELFRFKFDIGFPVHHDEDDKSAYYYFLVEVGFF